MLLFTVWKIRINLKQSANTYPTNAAGIEANVSGYNLALLSQFDKRFLLWII
jgi:hypothetical protein